MSERKRRGRPPKVISQFTGLQAPYYTHTDPVPLSTYEEEGIKVGMGVVNDSAITTDQLKTLLKAIYNSGQLGIRRSLDKDMATLQAILEGKTGV